METLMDNIVYVLGFLLAVSEVLSYIPFVRANSIVQLFVNIMRAVKGVVRPEVAPPPPPEN